MKALLSLIISGALVVSGFGQTRNVLVGTNNAVVQPTNFWSADASNARTGLGLGTAATNPASAFQPSSAILSNLATGNGTDLTNITATIVGTNVSITNVSGLQAALDGKLATNGSAANLTGFPASVLQTNSSLSLFPAGLLRTNGDGSGLTNLPVPAVASNVLSTIAIEKGGTGATNASGARIALGGTAVGINLFTAVDAAAARSTLGVVGSVGGVIAISNGGSGASTASGARTNFGLGESDGVTFSTIRSTQVANSGIYNITMGQTNTGFKGVGAGPSDFGYYRDGSLIWSATGANFTISSGLSFSGSSAGVSRTNLGIPWFGLTNTTASAFRNALEIGTTNTLTIAGLVAQNLTITAGGGITLQSTLSNAGSFRTNIGLPWSGLTSADAPAFRTALGLGTAATNPASAFQSSSANLTNLAANNGGSLTNLQATSLVGVIPSSNIATVNFSNLAGTLSIASGGTGATNAASARQNLGSTTVGDAVFVATNAAAARTVLGALSTSGDAVNLTNFPTLLLRTNGNGAGLTNLTAANITGTVALASNVTGTIAISNGGSGATTASGARSNLGLGSTNAVMFGSVTLDDLEINSALAIWGGQERIEWETRILLGGDWMINDGPLIIGSGGTNSSLYQAQTRTNLGLGWSALTNTTASGFQTALFGTGTNPVLVNTNGEVVSPTNFWQAAPIATTLQNSVPEYVGTTISTNAATNARLLFLFSLSGVQTGVTNVITLPTNGSTFNGDVATITHSGPTSSVTAVRQLGASTNIITLNQPEEAVRFLYRNNQWTLMDNISYVEPIYFSGTNAAANAAASRTNLGLGATWLTNTNVTNFRSAIGLGATNNVEFNIISLNGSGSMSMRGNAGDLGFYDSIDEEYVLFIPSDTDNVEINSQWNNSSVRSNLGLPLAALTNTSVTNFQKAIFYTNTAATNAGGNLGNVAAWIDIVASNGVTYKIPAYTNAP